MTLVALTAVVFTALLAWSPPAPSTELASGTIDRTLRCPTSTYEPGRRAVGVTTSSASPNGKAQLRVFMRAKYGQSRPFVDVVAPGRGSPPETGFWITGPCRAVRHSFRLSRAGLPGTLAPRSGHVHCNVGRTVLVRVRVTFAPWRGWRRYPAETGGRRYPAVLRGLGKPQSASIAVRSGGRVRDVRPERSGEDRHRRAAALPPGLVLPGRR
jgi:hypothetical protein